MMGAVVWDYMRHFRPYCWGSCFGKCDKSIRVIVIDASSSVVPPSRGVCGYGDYGMTDCGSVCGWAGHDNTTDSSCVATTYFKVFRRAKDFFFSQVFTG